MRLLSMTITLSFGAMSVSHESMRIPRLKPVRELALPAGHGPHAVGIEPDKLEGGWRGPSDAVLDAQGAAIIADTYNRRVLALDKDGRTRLKVATPNRIAPYRVSPAGTGWVVIAGMDAKESPRVACVRLGATRRRSPRASLRLADGWDILEIAADGTGTTYLEAAPPYGSSLLWQCSWNDLELKEVHVPGYAGFKCWGVTRGGSGQVYALMGKGRAVGLIQFDEKGSVVKAWDLSHLLADTGNEDFIGVDRRNRLYLAERITPDMLGPRIRADEWGYRVRCYALRAGGAALVAIGEIRYAKEDMEDEDPDVVAVGDGVPLRLGPDGSIVMRTATSRMFKLKFYAPPPWSTPSPYGGDG